LKYKFYTRFIGILIFSYLLTFVDYDELSYILKNKLEIVNLFVCLFLIPVVVFLKSYRWSIIINIESIKFNIIDNYLIYFSSLFYGIISPGRIGEFSKVIHLKNEKKIKSGHTTASIIIDRSFDLSVILIMSIFSMSFFINNDFRNYLILFIGVIILFITIILKLYPIINEFFRNRNTILFNYLSDLHQLYKKMSIYIIFQCLTISFICQIISYVQIFYICKFLQLSFGIIFLIGLSSLITLVSLVPITFAGIGSRDSLVIYLFSLKDISPEYAFLFSTIYLFIFYLGTSFFSLLALLIKPLKLKA
jgi:glycosyltransferase 2 family protein